MMNSLKPFELSLSGVNLIEASAGTGKTYNITSLYVRTLIEKPVTVDQILVMTFTKAATKELKDRLLERLRESIDTLNTGEHKGDTFLKQLLHSVQDKPRAIDALSSAVRLFDRAAIFTIHGFCQQVMQQQAFESGAPYEAELVQDESELIQELVDDFWRRWVAEASDDQAKIVLLKYLVDEGYGPDKLAREVGYLSLLEDKKIVPEHANTENSSDHLQILASRFKKLQRIWNTDRSEVIAKLLSEPVSGRRFRKDWINGWSAQMADFLDQEIPPIALFDKFSRFTQTYVDGSLKKSATERVTHPFFAAAESYLKLVEPFSDYPIVFKLQLADFLKEELPRKKEQLGVISYSDQLSQIRSALKGTQGKKLAELLREKYPVALVDEYQDTDPVQYDIFRTIYGSGGDDIAFFMIGDPKQSIYGFRGADIFSYLKARKKVADDHMFGLTHNYRSIPKLIKGLNNFWGRLEKPFVVDEIIFSKVKAGRAEEAYRQLKEGGEVYPPIHFRKLSEAGDSAENKGDIKHRAAEDTAKEIQRLLQGGQTGDITIGSKALSGKDIAVLVRKHDQADLIGDALQERDIKSVQYSDQSVFKSDEAEQLAYVLEAVITPGDEQLIKTALATPLLGYEPQELIKIKEDTEAWSGILNLFTECHEAWEQKGFAAMLSKLMQEMNMAKQLAQLKNGERRLTNIFHLSELLHHEAQHYEGMRRLLKWMRRKINDDQKGTDEEQLRLESDEDLVKIVTMHSSKGLEFPVVFCPFLWHGPNISDSGQVLEYHKDGQSIIDLSGKKDENRTEKRQIARREQLAEDMRLAYVAMTRAEHRCYLTWCYAKNSEFSSLGYLLYGGETAVKALNNKIEKNFDDLGNQPADEAMKTLCRDYPDYFRQEPIHHTEQKELGLFGVSGHELQPARTFTRSTPLSAGEAVSSFSSLVRTPDSNPDVPDYDQFMFEAEDSGAQAAHTNDMFGFPKGAGPGTCLHTIFEEIEFSNHKTFNRVIADNLSRHDISLKWDKVVEEMLKTTVQKEFVVSGSNFSLANISPGQLIREMEFYYSSARIETPELFSIIRDEENIENIPQNWSASGFLKGFIDLTFAFDGKFYLLDYKSNHLGDTVEDYDQQTMQEEMTLAAYDLQYHIYTIALHRYLKNRLPNYSYEKHFGGAFYLFLRGINTENNNGIFYDRPDYKTVQQLDKYLLSGVKQ